MSRAFPVTRVKISATRVASPAPAASLSRLSRRPVLRAMRMTVVGWREPDRPGGPAHIVAGRGVGRSHYEMVVDTGTGLASTITAGSGGRNCSASSASPGQVASSGDPVGWMTLLDSQRLQFDLAPPAARACGVARRRNGQPRHRQCGDRAPRPGGSARRSPRRACGDEASIMMTQREQGNNPPRVGRRPPRSATNRACSPAILLVVWRVIIALIIYDDDGETGSRSRLSADLADRTIVAMIVQRWRSDWSVSS